MDELGRMRMIRYDHVCSQILNEPERCVSAVRQDAGSYTGLGLFANATHKEEPDQFLKKTTYWQYMNATQN